VKNLWIIIFALLCGLRLSGQSIPISGFVVNQYGSPVAGAQVYICSAAGSSGLPCSPVASIYQDYNLTISTANPTQTDANGDFTVYAGALAFPNMYVVNAVPQSGTVYTWVVPGPTCSLGGCTFTGPATAPIFNATTGFEVNGTALASTNLSDSSNLARLTVANIFTGATQTAPIWNATTGFDVNGTPLASTNLSDSANLAYLNAFNDVGGTTNTFQTVNAVSGYKVNGVALASTNLSDSSNLARLNASNTFTGALNATGYELNGTAVTINRDVIHLSVLGSPLASSQQFGYYVPDAEQVVTIPSGCTNSRAVAETAATASTTLTIYSCSTAFGTCSSAGTIVFGISGTVGTFTCASSITLTGSTGGGLYIQGPSSADATLGNIAIALYGVHN